MTSKSLLTREIAARLDAYIQERLDRGMEVVSVRTKDHRIVELYPGNWPCKRIAASLGLYMRRRRGTWRIEYRKNTHQYYVSSKPAKMMAGQGQGAASC